MQETVLKNLILDTLHRSGPITFEEYMRLCLYHPEWGYYTQGRERTGVAGDYFTSSDLHPIFARLIARQAAEMWELLGKPERFTWVEMGSGRGWFAHDFMNWVHRCRPDFDAALDYVAVEPSPHQRERLLERVQHTEGNKRIRVSGSLVEIERTCGGFFSNELIDAFPVHVVARERGRLREIYVTAEADGLHEKTGRLSDPAVAAYVARYAKELGEGERCEVNLEALRWIELLAEKLDRGFVLTIDYGDRAEHLYTPDRPRGTLLAYRGHTASEDFFSAPGETDLTAHVNFSALIDTGRRLGLEVAGLTTQERFLMAMGEANEFADLYDGSESEQAKLQARLKLKRLINPQGMGSVFKLLAQYRAVETPRLTGLKYTSTLEMHS